MQRLLFACAMALSLATCLYAQPDPNNPAPDGRQRDQQRPNFQMGAGMMGGGQNTMALEILPNGVFILRNGVLVKFETGTLKAGGTLELFGPMPPRPPMPENATDADRQTLRKWMELAVPRYAPATTLAKDGMLYIVIGTTFFRVNTATCALEAKNDLAAIPAAPAAEAVPGAAQGGRNNPRQNPMMGGPAMMKLENGALYVILQQELLSVDPKTGTVANRAPLPKELFQNLFEGMGGGRGNNPGGRQPGANPPDGARQGGAADANAQPR
ncbi:MAG: hypothetical protein ACYC7E_08730 [Armatimonadota bacterium]